MLTYIVRHRYESTYKMFDKFNHSPLLYWTNFKLAILAIKDTVACTCLSWAICNRKSTKTEEVQSEERCKGIVVYQI